MHDKSKSKNLDLQDNFEAGEAAADGEEPTFNSILQKELAQKLIKYEDIYSEEQEANEEQLNYNDLLNKHIDLTAKSYEIKYRVDFNNTEIIYTKRYFLPALFNRFYTV